MSFDVIVIGRLGVDIYPLQIGVGLPDVTTFGKYLGGSAANVAVAVTRYGRQAALVSRTGDDPFGVYLRRQLDEYAVDGRWVHAVAGLPTPVTFCEVFPPDHFPIYFYRLPKAPDLEIYPEELDLPAIGEAPVLWVTGTGLSAQPSRRAHLAALEARQRKPFTILDLDYRATLWDSRTAAAAALAEALPHVTVAVGNLDECFTAVGERDPYAAGEALLARGVGLAVVKRGPEGVLAMSATERVEVPPMKIDVVNGLGAGDAFGGALIHGLLAGWPLERVLRFANAAGALVASRLACSAAMPGADEVRALLAREGSHA